jgi:tRNA-2-methylthio-N6-dimethylallyladenosine synthase
MEGQVEGAVKASRLKTLQDLLDARQLAFNAASVGAVMEVLFDRPGKRPGQLAGRSPYMQAVHVDPPHSGGADAPARAGRADGGDAITGVIGSIARVRIVEAHGNSLKGALQGGAGPARIAAQAGPDQRICA